MASISKGRAFVSGETVTPTKLNELVDLATISNIATGDIADGAITNIKIAAVDAGKVTTGTLSVDRIANNSLPLAKLAAGALPSTVTVDSANITNLSIVDADIANAAAIADTKLATISTGGKVANSATTATSANTANAIVARDGSGGFSTTSVTASTLNATTVIVATDLLVPDKITHTGDTNTSIRFPANDTVTVETDGSERLRVASSGYIGVNESSPSQMIHVSLSDQPGIALEATGEGANEKTCDIINNGGALELRLVNDAYNDAETAIKIERTGFNVAQQRFYTGSSVERMTIKSGGQVRFVPLASDPAGAEEGDVYFNSVLKKLAVYDGTNWVAMH
jgi:hypothetical protein